MSSSLRRGASAAAVIAFSIASLAACGAGSDAQTLEVKPDNAATSVGNIKIQNALVITQPDVKATGPAVISATLFNSGTTAQTLDSIGLNGEGAIKITPAGGKGGPLTVPAGGSVVIGGKDNASAALASPSQALMDGSARKVTFSFSETGDVSLRAFVVPAQSYFTKWGPSDMPSAPGASADTSVSPSGSATGSPSASTSGKPSGGASSSATGTATATSSASAGQ